MGTTFVRVLGTNLKIFLRAATEQITRDDRKMQKGLVMDIIGK